MKNNKSEFFITTMTFISITFIFLLLMTTELVVFVMLPIMLLVPLTHILSLILIYKEVNKKDYINAFIVFVSMFILDILVFFISKIDYNFHA